MPKLMSLNDAAAYGIERVRQPQWANKLDHLKIDIIDDRPGPWLHLYAPFNKTPGRDSWPSSLREMAAQFEAGRIPTVSLNRMNRERMESGGCRVCSL
jgi:hypothetical protein